jgi:DNA-directed RNA polymerase specialized sigma24 family protein
MKEYSSDFKEKVKQSVEDNVPYEVISREFSISVTTIRKWFGYSRYYQQRRELAQQRRIDARAKEQTERELAEYRYSEMVRLRVKECMTNGQIARTLGIHTSTVYKYLGATPKRLGGRRTWEIEMRGRVRFLKAAGYSIREISDTTKVPSSTIGDWVRGMPCD